MGGNKKPQEGGQSGVVGEMLFVTNYESAKRDLVMGTKENGRWITKRTPAGQSVESLYGLNKGETQFSEVDKGLKVVCARRCTLGTFYSTSLCFARRREREREAKRVPPGDHRVQEHIIELEGIIKRSLSSWRVTIGL